MADINLTQEEADILISMEKHRENENCYTYFSIDKSIAIPLISADKREKFLLDISRGRINLLKGKYQNRARETVILVRLDFGGPPHPNPDGVEIPCPHLHIYREDYGDKWAVSVPLDKFPNTDDLWKTLMDFMAFCNITQQPYIEKDLFS
jgi:hypothetical protein